jgi:prepilin signal peptidase PulO-like enzyme (type II secretory pathway)
MMSALPMTLFVAAMFGCAAFLAMQAGEALCKRVVPFEDGPKPGKPPAIALLVGAALVGGIMASRGAALPALGISGLLCAALVAAWYSDVRCGIVPDAFTLAPLAVVLAVAVFTREWSSLVSAAVVFVPFACAALFSRGRGMGWGDVKLAALGGAVLGVQTAILAAAGACLVATFVNLIQRRGKAQPIAFAPYLSGAIALGLLFPFAL